MPTHHTHRTDPPKPQIRTHAVDPLLMDQLLTSLHEFLLATHQQAWAVTMLQRLNDLAEQSPAVSCAIDREVDVMLVQHLLEGNVRRERG